MKENDNKKKRYVIEAIKAIVALVVFAFVFVMILGLTGLSEGQTDSLSQFAGWVIKGIFKL